MSPHVTHVSCVLCVRDGLKHSAVVLLAVCHRLSVCHSVQLWHRGSVDCSTSSVYCTAVACRVHRMYRLRSTFLQLSLLSPITSYHGTTCKVTCLLTKQAERHRGWRAAQHKCAEYKTSRIRPIAFVRSFRYSCWSSIMLDNLMQCCRDVNRSTYTSTAPLSQEERV